MTYPEPARDSNLRYVQKGTPLLRNEKVNSDFGQHIAFTDPLARTMVAGELVFSEILGKGRQARVSHEMQNNVPC